MIDLKDRRSMSRLDVMKRASYNNQTAVLKELNSTGKKNSKQL